MAVYTQDSLRKDTGMENDKVIFLSKKRKEMCLYKKEEK